MIELQFEQLGAYLKNISVTKNGETIGNVIPSVQAEDEFRYYTDDVDVNGYLTQCLDFVFYHRSSDQSYFDDVFLWFYDEDVIYPKSVSSTDAFPNSVELLLEPNYRRPIQFLTCGQGLFIPKKLKSTWSSSKGDDNQYHIAEFEGRWLFCHPDGIRVAYEQMQNTTLEDDWHQIMSHLSDDHPDFEMILKTFDRL